MSKMDLTRFLGKSVLPLALKPACPVGMGSQIFLDFSL
jgi:hypothetical protein